MSAEIYTSSVKIFRVLDVLTRNFAVGMTNTEIAQAVDIPPSAALRCVNTLIETGYAQRIIDTERYRPSVRFAQKALSLLRTIEQQQKEIDQLKQRISRRP